MTANEAVILVVMARIYIPATMATLRRWRDDGESHIATAHAVTPGLREWYTDGDLEDLEYVAFTRAAQDALPLLRDDVSTPRRRVVVSADMDDTAVSVAGGDLGDSGVKLLRPVPLSAVAAIHVDGSGARTDVIAASGAWESARSGDEDLQFIVDSAEDHELEWYDPTELEQLLD